MATVAEMVKGMHSHKSRLKAQATMRRNRRAKLKALKEQVAAATVASVNDKLNAIGDIRTAVREPIAPVGELTTLNLSDLNLPERPQKKEKREKAWHRRTFTPAQKVEFVAQIKTAISQGQMIKYACQSVGIHESQYRVWAVDKTLPHRATTMNLPYNKAGHAKGMRRYSQDRRTELLAQVRQRIGNGASIGVACREIGISEQSYRTWSHAAGTN